MQIPVLQEKWSEDQKSCFLELEIKADLPFFNGHFPSQPIVPGAFQLEWVLGHCKRLGFTFKDLTHIKKVKFKSLMLPGTRVNLEITKSSPNKISFKYYSNDEIFSTGSLNL